MKNKSMFTGIPSGISTREMIKRINAQVKWIVGKIDKEHKAIPLDDIIDYRLLSDLRFKKRWS